MRKRVMLALLVVPSLQAGILELKPETLQAWDEYVHKAISCLKDRPLDDGHFLWIDDDQDRLSRVRKGEIVVWSVGENNPKSVPSGLIHDWRGAVFLPNVRSDDLLSVVRNYARYKEIYKPGVLDAKVVRQTAGEDRFSMFLRNGSYFTKIVVDGDFNSSYVQRDEKRWYSVSCATRVQEIDNYGQSGEHQLPPDQGHGYIWRICGLSQFEERDGGVYVDEEMIALSRDVPAMTRWLVDPIIRRVSKESLALSMDKTRTAVAAKAGETSVSANKSGSDATRRCRSFGTGCVR